MGRMSCSLVEVKFDEAKDTGTFTGYGSVFGVRDYYGDTVTKGAFRETVREAKKTGHWPAMLLQHGGWGMGAEDMTPIGIWTSMAEDDTGLLVEGKLALGTQRGKEAYELLKMTPRPAFDGLSIGYIAKEFTVGTKPDEPRRTLKKIELLEVSLVTMPANPAARVADVKSLLNPLRLRDLEEALRDGGLSQRDSRRAVSILKEQLQRDAGAPVTPPRDEASAALTELLADVRGARLAP